MREIKKIIIHCSASDRKEDDSIEALRLFHTGDPKIKTTWGIYETNRRGWTDIGYHYFITKNGIIHNGRPIHSSGAHCRGHNSDSIGICISGDKLFHKKQFLSMNQLVYELAIQFGLSKKDIYFHRDFTDKKNCPNFSRSELVVSLD